MSASDLLAGLGLAVWGSRFAWLVLAPLLRRTRCASSTYGAHQPRPVIVSGSLPARVPAPRLDPVAQRQLAVAAHRHFGDGVTARAPGRDSDVPDGDIIVVSRQRARDRSLAGHARPVLSVLDGQRGYRDAGRHPRR